eukprot:s375_g16.t1
MGFWGFWVVGNPHINIHPASSSNPSPTSPSLCRHERCVGDAELLHGDSWRGAVPRFVPWSGSEWRSFQRIMARDAPVMEGHNNFQAGLCLCFVVIFSARSAYFSSWSWTIPIVDPSKNLRFAARVPEGS